MTRVHRQEGAGGGRSSTVCRLLVVSGDNPGRARSREAVRAGREAVVAEVRVERETAAAEQWRLMIEVFELKLQLAGKRGRRSGVAGGEPWTAGSRGEPRGLIESAVESGAAAGGDRISNPGGTAIGFDGRVHVESMWWMGSESAPSPARSQASTSSKNGDNGAVPVQRENCENQVKQIKDVPLFDGPKAKFPAWKHNFLWLAKFHGPFGIFTDGVNVPVADETMSIAALQEAFPHENVQNHFIAWNILSRAIADNGDRDILRDT